MSTTLQNLFITKLPRNITDADLKQIFSEYKPTSAKVMLDAATGKSKGFGFVLFESIDQGSAAYDAMNHRHVSVHGHGFTLNIFPSKHDGRTACVESNALYVRNIPMSVTRPSVEQFLGSFGTLIYCAMREDHYGSPVWVIYVEYDCIECAKNALHSLHGNTSYFFDGPAPILAKFADCDEAKRDRRKRREETRPVSHSNPQPQQQQQIQQQCPPACVFPPPVQPQMFTPSPMVVDNGNNDSDQESPSHSQSGTWSGSGSYRHNPYNGVSREHRSPTSETPAANNPLNIHLTPQRVVVPPVQFFNV